MYTVLMLDDNLREIEAHRLYLQKKGCTVYTAVTFAQAVQLLNEKTVDAVLLDVRMPQSGGFDVCGQLRRMTDAPILFLSSCTADDDQIRGYLVGGSDYIGKDAALELLWLKLCSCIRRTHTETQRDFAPLVLDIRHQCALINGKNIELTHTEFTLLVILSSRVGHIWSVEELYRELWGSAGSVNATMVQIHISRMRAKIVTAFPQHEFIETVWKKGYQFVPYEPQV
jgi:DNA-binding response OmpR family regulator